jgi:ADP-heptose:LPS heptosyltransferase
LIVKMSSIGDVVHALPVATALRRRYPRLRITWAVESWTTPLVHGHPAIDRIVTFPPMRWRHASRDWLRSFTQAMRELRSERYDVSLDLQGLLKSAVVALCSRAPIRIGMHGQREGAALRDVRSESHDLPVQAEAATAVERILSALHIPPRRPLIVINPSTSAEWKTWPVRRWARVAEALAAHGSVVLVGSREQMARHAELVRNTAPQPDDFTGRTTLAELVALLDRCTIHLAGDTGSAHIAAALGRPVVGLYEPTTPQRKAPYGYESLVVYHAGQCRAGCPRFCWRNRPCLQAVTPAEVIARAREILAGSTPAVAG